VRRVGQEDGERENKRGVVMSAWALTKGSEWVVQHTYTDLSEKIERDMEKDRVNTRSCCSKPRDREERTV
jgi:hypothetical protein